MDITQVAGSRDDFQLVRHITLTGTQFEIGRRLAEEAQRLGWTPVPVDPTLSRARRTWFERHWPQHQERMDGAAAALGLDPEQDTLAMDSLSVPPQACSALWVPPGSAGDGHGRIGRNYDFFTLTAGQILGGPGEPGELPMASRPHVITSRPSDGMGTTIITMSDFDGCMDGVNAAGLAVVLLIADFAAASPPESFGPQAGLSSVQLPRFLLDTCENTDQAKQALLLAKHYDFGMPLHYLVADARGKAFVWERGGDGTEHIIDVGDAPLCVTNHPLHRHRDPMALPADSELTFSSFGRLRSLYEASKGVTMSADELRRNLLEVRQSGDPTMRTLWSSVLDTTARTLSISFYLGEGKDYSPELTFTASA
ncbi:C45 family autoproteolytic acyltransferase/hydrolase [Nonomuraea sp. NBC_01738]|uniref:C45 family peptidase n=1 Tax=Nonomuraea sp. NBC_01738 TaxID=2976003 RepID=UPI002E0DA023|nr:C45 family autoproteolytic acyltransferase/hydrolase [Nonomuraea sp. NBC_01738]